MVDWSKLSKNKQFSKPVDPMEIYDESDRSSTTGPLCENQKQILSQWFNNCYLEHDVIVKMHTGEGKTLVGLLMLQSRINGGNSPCVYVCPNDYLVEQVCDDAKKFGIKVCRVGADRELPEEYASGKMILVTNAQKMFNGLSKFGTAGSGKCEYVNAVLLDDSHTCTDIIKAASTIQLEKTDTISGIVYNELIELFRNDLIEQAEGSFISMEDGDNSSILVVPYWKWCDKKTKVLEILNKHRDDSSIKFAWQIIKDKIDDCICCITSSKIEISPYNPNVDPFISFCRANQRILMSATTQDDSYSIKCLNFSKNAVMNPLVNKNQKWFGEKMIIIPSLIDSNYDEKQVRNYVESLDHTKYGIVSIVPSRKISELYDSEFVATSNDIFSRVSKLREEKNGFLVVVNRYDGIDLPDDSCRVLLMDSMPYSDSLSDRYEEKCRFNSEIINKRLSQKIEQGFGRGVRGEKDYCVIIITGSKLIKFIKSSNTKSLFSIQMRKQIEICLDMIGESHEFEDVKSLINDCLQRNEGWKQYYKEMMDSICDDSDLHNLCDSFEKEHEIQQSFSSKNSAALNRLQYYIDDISDDSEKGWYLQELARYNYILNNKMDSMSIQQSAFEKNQNLLRPNSVKYKKIGKYSEKRDQKAIDYIQGFKSFEDFKLHVDEICDALTFYSDSNGFEKALCEIGKLIGFDSQRPDNECGLGPDNLWQVDLGRYFIFECKTSVNPNRQTIFRKESEQMGHSCIWFADEYPDGIAECYLIHPALELEADVVLNKGVRIIRVNNIRKLSNNIQGMVSELSKYNLRDLTTDLIRKLLHSHYLDPDIFKNEYSEDYKRSA